MKRPTSEELASVRDLLTNPGGPLTVREVSLLFSEIDAQRELLRHLLLSHRPCGAGCDWSERVDAERIRLRAGDGVVW